MVAVVAALQVTPAGAQGNIDAGKTPAQIFGDTCSACHRSAREFRRASASFLRGHYTAGSEEASAMASYLAGLGSEPRPNPPRRPPAEVSKQARQPPAEHPAAPARSAQPKARPSASVQVRVVPEERPPDPPPPPPVPVLEPFEE
jgi:hypothetical protein